MICGNPICTKLLKPEQKTFCSLKCLRDTKNLKHLLGKDYHVKVWRARREYLDEWNMRFEEAIKNTY